MAVANKHQSAPATSAVYWQAVRAFSFPASVVSVLLGTALAFRGYGGQTSSGAFDPIIFLVTLMGAVLSQAGANVLNDYFDYVKGVDTKPEHGSGVLTQGLLSKPQMLRFGVVLLLLAAVCGGLLVFLRGPNALAVALPLAVVGLLCAVLYPMFLKRFALGDLLVIVSFGIGITLGAYGMQTPFRSQEQWWFVIAAALPPALIVDGILHANNLRDRSGDRAAGVHTVATLLSDTAGTRLFAFLLFAPVALIVGGVALGQLPLAALAVGLALPLLAKAYKTVDVPLVAQAHLVFGVLYALAAAIFPPS